MALEFMDEKPKSTRGGGGGRSHKYMTEEVVAELQENPNKWGAVAKGVPSGQSVAQWIDKQNGRDKNNKKNDGPWQYTAIANGEKVKNRDGKDVPAYDVWVSYTP